MSLANSVAYCEWEKVKINFIDTPGFNMFVHEAKAAMIPAEAALVVVDAAAGVQAMTQRVWGYAEEFNLPRVIVANRMDRDTADPDRVIDSCRNAFGRQVVPLQLPIGA